MIVRILAIAIMGLALLLQALGEFQIRKENGQYSIVKEVGRQPASITPLIK